MKQLREEIEATLNEEKENLEIYMEKPNHRNDNLIGWIEALEYVLGRIDEYMDCLLYTSPSPRDVEESRMPSSA